MVIFKYLIFGFTWLISYNLISQEQNIDDVWILAFEEDACGYRDSAGNWMIPPGKYNVCFTDTMKNYAVVIHPQAGLVAIDRNEKILYPIFNFDNGPDYPSDGLFRIIEDEKIGYADFETGKVIIPPLYACAYPFENGKARVSLACEKIKQEEYTTWLSENWHFIDKQGKIID